MFAKVADFALRPGCPIGLGLQVAENMDQEGVANKEDSNTIVAEVVGVGHPCRVNFAGLVEHRTNLEADFLALVVHREGQFAACCRIVVAGRYSADHIAAMVAEGRPPLDRAEGLAAEDSRMRNQVVHTVVVAAADS